MAENLSRSTVAEYLRSDWKAVGRCMARVRGYNEPNLSKRLDNLVNISIDETSYHIGFRNMNNMIDIIMLVCSNIKIPLPNRPTEKQKAQ